MSQQHVAGALDAVAEIGWDVPDADKITALALADDSFLVRELSTPAGRKFMRKIARHAGHLRPARSPQRDWRTASRLSATW